jgi:HAD superfamily hydrolase (TIGR01509 family)
LIRTLIFDLDGTIVDTEPTAARVIREVFSHWNLSLHPDDADYICGRKWEVVFDFLYSKYQIPVPKTLAAEKVMEGYRSALAVELPVVPGSVNAIRELSQTFPIGIVSGSHRREIEWAINQLGIASCFRFILGAEDYPKSKPAPDGYHKALEIMKEKAENTLVFEDSWAGIEAARKAGMWVVGVEAANHLGHDQSAAHQRISDFRDINANWVNSFSSK